MMKIVTYSDAESLRFRPMNNAVWFRPGTMITTATSSNVRGIIVAVNGKRNNGFEMTVLWSVAPRNVPDLRDYI